MEYYGYDLIKSLKYQIRQLDNRLRNIRYYLHHGSFSNENQFLAVKSDELKTKQQLNEIDQLLKEQYRQFKNYINETQSELSEKLKSRKDSFITIELVVGFVEDWITLTRELNNTTYSVSVDFDMSDYLEEFLKVINSHCGNTNQLDNIGFMATFTDNQFIHPLFNMTEDDFSIENHNVEIKHKISDLFAKIATSIDVDNLYLTDDQIERLTNEISEQFNADPILSNIVGLDIYLKEFQNNTLCIRYNFNYDFENMIRHLNTPFHQKALKICIDTLKNYCK